MIREKREKEEAKHRADVPVQVDEFCHMVATSVKHSDWCVERFSAEFLASKSVMNTTLRSLNDCIVRGMELNTELILRCVYSRRADLYDRELDRLSR